MHVTWKRMREETAVRGKKFIGGRKDKKKTDREKTNKDWKRKVNNGRYED